MKLKQLIAQLQQLDGEMDVFQYDNEHDRFLPPDFWTINTAEKTRDFSKCLPKGHTEKILCI